MPQAAWIVAAISRYSAARGPSVPSILRGNPITSRSALLSCTSAAMASAVCCGRRLWMTVVRPTMLPLASEMAIPVRASP